MQHNQGDDDGAQRQPASNPAKNDGNRLPTQGRPGRGPEYAARNDARRGVSRDRAKENATRNESRRGVPGDRAQEYKARDAARRAAPGDRAHEYAARNEARRAVGEQVADAYEKIATDRIAREQQNQHRMAAAANARQSADAHLAAAAAGKPCANHGNDAPLDDDSDNVTHRNGAADVVLRARALLWAGIAPPPADVQPPDPLSGVEELALTTKFWNCVHKANVINCAWCAELVIEERADGGTVCKLAANDLRLVPAERRIPPAPGHNFEHDERDRERGFIRKLAFTDEDGAVKIRVCRDCFGKITRGKARSVWQTGCDFGAVPEALVGLSDAERAFVAIHHPFAKIIKVKMDSGAEARTGRGHVITFPQDSARVLTDQHAAAELPVCRDLSEAIAVHFIGPRGHVTTIDGTLRRGPLQARAWKILDAFTHLTVSHPQYQQREISHNFDFNAAVGRVIDAALVTDNDARGAARSAHVLANADFEAADRHQEQREPLVMEGEVAMDIPPENVANSSDPMAAARWVTRQDANPLNEFEQNRELIGGAFPHLLPTGAFPSNNFPTERELHHMMAYYDKRFQSDSSFIFLLNNQRVRHKICRNNARVDPRHADALRARLTEPGFANNFQATMAAAESGKELTPEQDAILKFVHNAVRIPMRKIAFTEGDRAPGFWHIMSIMRCRGLPSFFLTISPSAVDNSLGMRLAVAKLDDIFHIAETMDYDERSREVFAKPSSSAIFFRHFQRAVIEILLGFDITSKSTASATAAARDGNSRGVLGTVREIFSATECQGRTLLHAHMLIWTDFTPHHVTELARTGRLDDAIRVMEQMVLTTMPKEYFEWREQLWANREHVPVAGLELPQEQLGWALWWTLGRYQHHYQHKPTCKKDAAKMLKKFGCAYCRLGFARPHHDSTQLILMNRMPKNRREDVTKFTKELTQEDATVLLPCAHINCICDPLIYHPPPPVLFANCRPKDIGVAMAQVNDDAAQQQNPALVDGDGAPRRVELRRSELFAECNKTLSCACLCNLNLATLWSEEAAVSTAGYVTEYITKGDGSINIATPTIIAAVADETAGLNRERTLLNRFSMAATAMTETPSTMAALALLGNTRYVTAALFVAIFPHDALKAIDNDTTHQMLGLTRHHESDQDQAANDNDESLDSEAFPDMLDVITFDDDAREPDANDNEADLPISINDRGQIQVNRQWENYRLRPVECEQMNPIEYVCCTQEIARPAEGEHEEEPAHDADDSDKEDEEAQAQQQQQQQSKTMRRRAGEGRALNARFFYHEGHPRRDTVYVKLRSKMAYPALSGAAPPRLPRRNACDTTGLVVGGKTVLAQRWTWYWALLLLPWRNDEEWQMKTFQEMRDFVVDKMHGKDGLARAAAWYAYRCTWGTTTTNLNRTFFQAYRYCNADLVVKGTNKRDKEEEEEEEKEIDEGEGPQGEADDDGADSVDEGEIQDALHFAEIFNALNGFAAAATAADGHAATETFLRQQYEAAMGNSVAILQAAGQQHRPLPLPAIRNCSDEQRRAFANKLHDIRDFKIRQPQHGRRRNANDGPRAHQDANDDVLNGPFDFEDFRRLNDAQKHFCEIVFGATEHHDNPAAQHLFWLDGAAGCGKTFATRVLMRAVREWAGEHNAVLGCAFQGNAACNLEFGARTIHSSFNVKAFGGQARQQQQLQPTVLRTYFQNLRLVVIEEIGMVSAEMLDIIDLQLRRAFDTDRPFADVVVLALGDFLQIPPVKGTPLPKAALSLPTIGETGAIRGGQLWRSAQRICLNDAMRARGCPVQLARLHEMRRLQSFTRKMYDDIGVLDEQTVRRDQRWITHTSLHATNAARIIAGDMHLRRFARHTNKLLYRWKLPLPERIKRMGLPERLINALYANVPEMWQTFVEGARYMVLENFNVQLGLTNGAIGTACALYFAVDNAAAVAQAEDDARARGEIEVRLPCAPTVMHLWFPVPPNVTNVDELPGEVTEERRWIVPLVPTKLDAIKLGCIPGAPSVTPMGFNVAQAYALTIHKSQGLTLSPVVLDLAKPIAQRGGTNMTWEMIYVAISRAPSDADLRVLPTEGHAMSVDYLFKKKPQRTTTDYLRPQNWSDDGKIIVRDMAQKQLRRQRQEH